MHMWNRWFVFVVLMLGLAGCSFSVKEPGEFAPDEQSEDASGDAAIDIQPMDIVTKDLGSEDTAPDQAPEDLTKPDDVNQEVNPEDIVEPEDVVEPEDLVEPEDVVELEDLIPELEPEDVTPELEPEDVVPDLEPEDVVPDVVPDECENADDCLEIHGTSQVCHEWQCADGGEVTVCQEVASSGGTCDDGDACTSGDLCIEGTCEGTLVLCDDLDGCTDDDCDPDNGCFFVPNLADCDDGDPCTVDDKCGNGVCVGEPVECQCFGDADCLNLGDWNLCNGPVYCNTQVVPFACEQKPEPAICPVQLPAIPCMVNACQPDSGECMLQPVQDGLVCDDANKCTLSDHCKSGQCSYVILDPCEDNSECTLDGCAPDSGCWHEDVVCDDGNERTFDGCADATGCFYQDIDCDDSNLCTVDVCDKDTGCSYADKICNDFDPCTYDGCDPGEGCFYSEVNCNDNDDCTMDECSKEQGECVHTPIPECGCLEAGGPHVPGPDGQILDCCDGLELLPVCEWFCFEEGCTDPCVCPDEKFYCANCGYGECAEGEHYCNCPQDCDPPENVCLMYGGGCYPGDPTAPQGGCPDGTEVLPYVGCGVDEICCTLDDNCEADSDCPQGYECTNGLCEPAKSCYGACGGQSLGNCFCDEACFGYGDCCDDVCDTCEEYWDVDPPLCPFSKICGDGICGWSGSENCSTCPVECACDPGTECVEGECQCEGKEEICFNNQDDDCDGLVDEGCQWNCSAPEGYPEVPVALLLLALGQFDGEKIAVQGSIQEHSATCSGPPCNDGNECCQQCVGTVRLMGINGFGSGVPLVAKSEDQQIGCYGDNCSWAWCNPDIGSSVWAWGVFHASGIGPGGEDQYYLEVVDYCVQ